MYARVGRRRAVRQDTSGREIGEGVRVVVLMLMMMVLLRGGVGRRSGYLVVIFVFCLGLCIMGKLLELVVDG